MLKKLSLMLIAITVLGVIMSGCGFSSSNASSSSGNTNTITIGSKNFTENIVLGDIFYYLLKAKMKGVTVLNQPNLGGTMVAWNALLNGQVNSFPEYTGTGLVNILKQPTSHDPNKTYQIVKSQYARQYKVDWLNQLGFNDTYAIAVPQSVAKQYNLKTVSDLKKVASKLVFGAEPEFFSRPDGYPGFIKTYGLQFSSTKQIDTGLKYAAAGSNQVQVIDAYSTDGDLIKYNMTLLQDDQGFFPPYYAAPIVREDTLKAHPEMASILNQLAGKIDNSTMQKLNYQVDVEKKSPDDVAKQFLTSLGLLS